MAVILNNFIGVLPIILTETGDLLLGLSKEKIANYKEEIPFITLSNFSVETIDEASLLEKILKFLNQNAGLVIKDNSKIQIFDVLKDLYFFKNTTFKFSMFIVELVEKEGGFFFDKNECKDSSIDFTFLSFSSLEEFLLKENNYDFLTVFVYYYLYSRYLV